MAIEFDLISDLHLDTPNFDWSNRATSRFCLILGDIAQDRPILKKTLTEISRHYLMVMYIDGNLELKQYLNDLDSGYQLLKNDLKNIKNLNFMYDNIIVLNDVAFVCCNGWWNFDFNDRYSMTETEQWYRQVVGFPCDTAQISLTSIQDVSYLVHSIKKLQDHDEIKHIIVGTHTVPRLDLINHDLSLIDDIKLNVMGHDLLGSIRNVDYKRKINTWCFGHYHGRVDRVVDGVRYVNNCLGKQHNPYLPYYPLRIEIN
jgi:predicted phosphodiesterase